MGGLNGAVFGDTPELLVGWVVVVGVLELITVEAVACSISLLVMLASLSFVFISSCPEKDGGTHVSSEKYLQYRMFCIWGDYNI